MPINDDSFQENDGPEAEKRKPEPDDIDAGSSFEEDDDIIDLSDVSLDSSFEDVLELEQVVEPEDPEEDVLELTDLQPTSPAEDEDVIELGDESAPEPLDEEEILDLTMEAAAAPLEDVMDLTAEASADIEGEEVLDLTEFSEPASTEIETPRAEDTGEALAVSDEDQEIMSLIDDIQSSLDESEAPPAETEQPVEADTAGPAIAMEAAEPEKPIILGDEETLEPEPLSESESEFVDHLGLDLTSEFSKEMFDGESSLIDPKYLEESINQALKQMLSEADSPLMQAIQKVVKEIMDKNVG